jgi:hypothetical protein
MIYRYLRYSSVKRLLEDHRNGTANNAKILFSLVMLEQTLRIHAGNSLHHSLAKEPEAIVT